MLAKHALHPHAAARLIDWSLSKEGQSMVTSFGRVVLRKSVNPKLPVLMEKALFVADGEFLALLLEENARDFRQIFLAGRWAELRRRLFPYCHLRYRSFVAIESPREQCRHRKCCRILGMV